MIAVHGWHASGAGKHRRPGSVVSKLPEFFACGKVQTTQHIPHLIIPVEEVNLAICDNRAAETLSHRNRPENRRTICGPGA